MAASDNSDSNRFVYRPPERKAQPYYIPITRTGSIIKPNSKAPLVLPTPMVIRSADALTARAEAENPARRVVVIRTNKHPPVDEGPIDLGDLERSKSLSDPEGTTDGHKTLFLIRRPITQTASAKPTIEYQSPLRDPSPINSPENILTPTPPLSPPEIVISPDTPPSPVHHRPKTSKPVDTSQQRFIPYLRQPRNKSRTSSPTRLTATRRSPSPVRTRSKPSKRPSPPSSPPPPPLLLRYSPKHEESQEINHKQTIIPIHSPPPPTLSSTAVSVTEQQTIQHHSRTTNKNLRTKKSPRSVVVVSPTEPSVAIVENTLIKEETSQPVVKRSKSVKKTRFEDEFKDESSEELMFQTRSQKCLSCLARCMCLVIIICVLVILIGLAGVGVSAYFLATDATNNFIPTVVGIAVGGALAIAALCFLCILLACLGARDGYFKYNRKAVRSGGRAFARIPPTHPNAHQYLPYDNKTISENHHTSTTTHSALKQPSSLSLRSATTTVPQTQQYTTQRSNTSSSVFDTRSSKHSVIIEMPEQLLSTERVSPRTRERSLTKIVRNIGHIVDDTKRRNHGDLPDRLVVKVDQDGTPTI